MAKKSVTNLVNTSLGKLSVLVQPVLHILKLEAEAVSVLLLHVLLQLLAQFSPSYIARVYYYYYYYLRSFINGVED